MRAGQTFAAYQLVQRLGQGDDFETWLARANWVDGDNRPVVVEVMEHDNHRSGSFLEEAWNLARLNHPTIAQVFDVGQLNGWCYLARQHVAAPSLHELHDRCMGKGGALPVWFVLRVAQQVCEGLDYVRRHTPSRVHQSVDLGTVAVLHWGQSKLVALGQHDTSVGACKDGPCTCDVLSIGAIVNKLIGPDRVTPELDKVIKRALGANGAPIATPGELRDALAGTLASMGDRHGQPEVGMFVSSLYPDFHRGVAQRSDSLFWEQLNNFMITEGENRRTEDKLVRTTPVEQTWTSEVRRTARGSSWIMRLMGSQVDSKLKERSRRTQNVSALTQPHETDRGMGDTVWEQAAATKKPIPQQEPTDRVAEIWSGSVESSPPRDIWTTRPQRTPERGIWDRPPERERPAKRERPAEKAPATDIWDRRPEATPLEQLDSKVDIWTRPPVAPVRREGEPAPVADIWERRQAPPTEESRARDIGDVWERGAQAPEPPEDSPPPKAGNEASEDGAASVWDAARPVQREVEEEQYPGSPDVYKQRPRSLRTGGDVFSSLRPSQRELENPFAAPDGRRRKKR
jgi:hypothetical protein